MSGQIVFWILFGNAVLAIPVAYVASEKGRSAVGFFFLSFFFSFFSGILVILALPRIQHSVPLNDQKRDLVKCPFCAEWVKIEATVCRFCGRDIAEKLEAIAVIDREAAAAAQIETVKKQIVALEELARASQERAATQVASRDKRRAFYRKPSTITSGIALILLAAAGVATLAVSTANSNAAELERVARANAVIVAAHSDWATLMITCGSLKRADVSFILSPDSKSLEVMSKDTPDIDWTTCIGDQFAIDAPNEFMGKDKFKDGLGWHVQESIGANPQSGVNGTPLTVDYGNLKVVTKMPYSPSDPVVMLITRD